MQLKDFLSISEDAEAFELRPLAQLVQLYWEARQEGRPGLKPEDVEEDQVEFLIELFHYDAAAGVYIHPQTEELFQAAAGKGKCSTLDLFEDFWKRYPRKVGKAAARAVWVRKVKTRDLAERVVSALKRHDAYYQWPRTGDQTGVPHARTWLHQERWDDELPDGHIVIPTRPRFGHGATEDALAGVV